MPLAIVPTPRAYMADDDLALERIIEALSESPFWKNTVVFVLEDDAQSGPDHVDSHRSILMVISAYNRVPWSAIKGGVPYPVPGRVPLRNRQRSR